MKYIFVVICFLCTTPIFSQTPYDYKDEVRVLVSETLPLDEAPFTPYITRVINDEWILISDVSIQPALWLYKIEGAGELTFVESFGIRGRGPGEFLAVWDIFPDDGGKFFWVYDPTQKRITPFGETREAITDEIITAKMSGMPVNFHKEGEFFFISGITMNSRLKKINMNGETAEMIGVQDELSVNTDRISPQDVAAQWYSYSVKHPDQNKIMVFTRKAANVELYSTGGARLKSRKDAQLGIPKTGYRDGRLMDSPDSITGYIGVTGNNDRVFALYSGRNNFDENSGFANFIHVFDWDLNLITIFELDHESISIEVDPFGNLYSVQHDPSVEIRYIVME